MLIDGSKSDSMVAVVKNRIEIAQERVTKFPNVISFDISSLNVIRFVS